MTSRDPKKDQTREMLFSNNRKLLDSLL